MMRFLANLNLPSPLDKPDTSPFSSSSSSPISLSSYTISDEDPSFDLIKTFFQLSCFTPPLPCVHQTASSLLSPRPSFSSNPFAYPLLNDTDAPLFTSSFSCNDLLAYYSIACPLTHLYHHVLIFSQAYLSTYWNTLITLVMWSLEFDVLMYCIYVHCVLLQRSMDPPLLDDHFKAKTSRRILLNHALEWICKSLNQLQGWPPEQQQRFFLFSVQILHYSSSISGSSWKASFEQFFHTLLPSKYPSLNFLCPDLTTLFESPILAYHDSCSSTSNGGLPSYSLHPCFPSSSSSDSNAAYSLNAFRLQLPFSALLGPDWYQEQFTDYVDGYELLLQVWIDPLVPSLHELLHTGSIPVVMSMLIWIDTLFRCFQCLHPQCHRFLLFSFGAPSLFTRVIPWISSQTSFAPFLLKFFNHVFKHHPLLLISHSSLLFKHIPSPSSSSSSSVPSKHALKLIRRGFFFLSLKKQKMAHISWISTIYLYLSPPLHALHLTTFDKQFFKQYREDAFLSSLEFMVQFHRLYFPSAFTSFSISSEPFQSCSALMTLASSKKRFYNLQIEINEGKN